MSRQLRVERDHVSRCDLREQRDFRDLRDLRDIRDPRDLRDYRDFRDDRDDTERSRDDYLDYDHHPTAAATSSLANNPLSRFRGETGEFSGWSDEIVGFIIGITSLCVFSRSVEGTLGSGDVHCYRENLDSENLDPDWRFEMSHLAVYKP
ncbi:hypothetical protein WN48_01198 [Eufriesea mexicana]|nr:hypothetical protein WN48_01198 [Eufriesea mexicana]